MDLRYLIPIVVIAVGGILLAVLLYKSRKTAAEAKPPTPPAKTKNKGFSEQPTSTSAQSYIRKTDSIHLSKGDRHRKILAEKQIKSGQVLEGAKTLERLGFERQAISALENSGYVEEACAILKRMERPSRAAVIYERNGFLEKAAWHYSVAKQFEKSAECWKKLGREDYRYFSKGIDNLRSCGQEHLMFNEMMALLMHENVVSTAFRHNKMDELIIYLRNVEIAKEVFPLLNADQLERLIKKVSISPEMTIICASWIAEVQVLRIQEALLNRFLNHEDLFFQTLEAVPERAMYDLGWQLKKRSVHSQSQRHLFLQLSKYFAQKKMKNSA